MPTERKPTEPPRPKVIPGVPDARKRQASSDDLSALAASEALEARARTAAVDLAQKSAEADRERAARQAAEQRATELEQRLNAATAPPFPPPAVQATKPAAVEATPGDAAEAELVSGFRRGRLAIGKLGWLLGALTALGAVGGAGVIGGQVALNPRPAKQENVDVANERLESLEKWRKSIAPWQAYDYGDRAAKETILLDFLCLQGFRPEGLPCQDIHDRARQLRTDRVIWPSPRLPPNPEQR